MTERSWAPDYLARYFFTKQDEVWITADGRVMPIDEMDNDHLVSTLLMVERVSEDIEHSIDMLVQDTVLYKAMRIELRRRLELSAPRSAVVPEPEVEGDILAYVRNMVADDSGVVQAGIRITYVDSAGISTERTVFPEKVWQRGDHWFMRGFDTFRQADRTFRIDRVVDYQPA